MEAVIEKECSALGGLFQTIISDMKVGRRGRGCGAGRRALTWPRRLASAGQPPVPVCAAAIATCGSAPALVSPAQPGRPFGLCWVTGRAASSGMFDVPSPPPAHCPRGRPQLVFLGGSGPRLQVFHCLSLDGVSATRRGWILGGHLIPRYGEGAPGAVLGALPGLGKEPPPEPGREATLSLLGFHVLLEGSEQIRY